MPRLMTVQEVAATQRPCPTLISHWLSRSTSAKRRPTAAAPPLLSRPAGRLARSLLVAETMSPHLCDRSRQVATVQRLSGSAEAQQRLNGGSGRLSSRECCSAGARRGALRPSCKPALRPPPPATPVYTQGRGVSLSRILAPAPINLALPSRIAVTHRARLSLLDRRRFASAAEPPPRREVHRCCAGRRP